MHRLTLNQAASRPYCWPIIWGTVAVAVLGCDADSGHPLATEPAEGEATSAPLEEELLRDRIDTVLVETLRRRELDVRTNAAWQVLHGVLAYGGEFPLLTAEGEVPTVAWLLDGGALAGWSLRPASHGVQAIVDGGSLIGQGHEDQWLAILAQCDLPSDREMRVGGTTYRMRDLLTQAMHDLYEGKECSWTLIGLSTYLALDQTWPAGDGQTWSLEKIMQMEARQTEGGVVSGACGGTHRLIGMQMALNRFRAERPQTELTGGWLEAADRIAQSVALARRYQQPSGAFSVQYFIRPATAADLRAHFEATGHTLELLALTLTPQALAEPWVVRAANYLCELFEQTYQLDLECGSLYHAAHGLRLYRARRFGDVDYVALAQQVTEPEGEAP